MTATQEKQPGISGDELEEDLNKFTSNLAAAAATPPSDERLPGSTPQMVTEAIGMMRELSLFVETHSFECIEIVRKMLLDERNIDITPMLTALGVEIVPIVDTPPVQQKLPGLEAETRVLPPPAQHPKRMKLNRSGELVEDYAVSPDVYFSHQAAFSDILTFSAAERSKWETPFLRVKPGDTHCGDWQDNRDNFLYGDGRSRKSIYAAIAALDFCTVNRLVTFEDAVVFDNKVIKAAAEDGIRISAEDKTAGQQAWQRQFISAQAMGWLMTGENRAFGVERMRVDDGGEESNVDAMDAPIRDSEVYMALSRRGLLKILDAVDLAGKPICGKGRGSRPGKQLKNRVCTHIAPESYRMHKDTRCYRDGEKNKNKDIHTVRPYFHIKYVFTERIRTAQEVAAERNENKAVLTRPIHPEYLTPDPQVVEIIRKIHHAYSKAASIR